MQVNKIKYIEEGNLCADIAISKIYLLQINYESEKSMLDKVIDHEVIFKIV